MPNYTFKIEIKGNEIKSLHIGNKNRSWSHFDENEKDKVIEFAKQQKASEEEMAVIRKALELFD